MDMNPQRVRTAEFQTVKKGLDPTEVREFLTAVADELERAQNQSTAMEARARAAVARLQELSDGATTQSEAAARREPETSTVVPVAETTTSVTASVDQAETISRTLLLAQRTADTTMAEAEAEAARMRVDAEAEAARTIDSTRGMAAQLLDEARDEARKVGASERLEVETAVNSLVARRDFLESDVDHLEQFLIAQRSRLREAANELIELTDRVPSGLGDVRRPLLSASDDVEEPTSAPVAEHADTVAAPADEPGEPDDDSYIHVSEDDPNDTPSAAVPPVATPDPGQDPLLTMQNDDGADLTPDWSDSSDEQAGEGQSGSTGRYGFGDNN